MLYHLISLFLLSHSCSGQLRTTREDGKCGEGNIAENGLAAKCDDIAPFPTCCQKNGHCGWDCQGVASSNGPASAPVSAPVPTPTFTSNGRYRSDGRCGAQFPLEDGVTPAECDPNSQYWCCSEKGWCGGTQEHCYCDTCVNYRPINEVNGVRSDRRCGASFPLSDGTASKCDGASANPCCSSHGYCGPGADHCSCVGCVDYTSGTPKTTQLVTGRIRADRRCGREFPLPDGKPSECDPNTLNSCCSKWGYCGPGADHCDCPECIDFRSSQQKVSEDFIGKVRKDRRCGPEFPLPDSKLPSQCDPKSANFCCSKWGFCGGDEEHCNCPECVNYNLIDQ